MKQEKRSKELSFNQAFLTFACIVGIIGVGLFKFSISLHSLILCCLIVSVISSLRLGYSYLEVRDAMNDGIREALAAIYIFIMIGVLIAAFIESGTLGTLIYFGIRFIEPGTFLPAGLLLCSLMSMVIGSSWATVGTIGVILMGIGTSIGFPAALVAGMVISGACFGDKMSPVSDTTNLAAMSAGTTLSRHMQSMCYTTIPTYLLALAIFTWCGLGYSDSILPDEELSSLTLALDHTFNISLITIFPILVMVVMSFMRAPAEVSMMVASLVAVLLALTIQGRPIAGVMDSLFSGSSIRSGVASLDDLLGRGGILSMMWTLSLSLMALALGGVLNKFGFLRTLIAGILKRIRHRATLVMTTILSCIFGNSAMGEAYMSIILGGQLFSGAYDELGIDRAVLSRSLEEGATLTVALIPWTTGGAFMATTLGVSALDYAPMALLNWLNPVVGISFAFLGIGLISTAHNVSGKAAESGEAIPS